MTDAAPTASVESSKYLLLNIIDITLFQVLSFLIARHVSLGCFKHNVHQSEQGHAGLLQFVV